MKTFVLLSLFASAYAVNIDIGGYTTSVSPGQPAVSVSATQIGCSSNCIKTATFSTTLPSEIVTVNVPGGWTIQGTPTFTISSGSAHVAKVQYSGGTNSLQISSKTP